MPLTHFGRQRIGGCKGWLLPPAPTGTSSFEPERDRFQPSQPQRTVHGPFSSSHRGSGLWKGWRLEARVGIEYPLYIIDCVVIICTEIDQIPLARTPAQYS